MAECQKGGEHGKNSVGFPMVGNKEKGWVRDGMVVGKCNKVGHMASSCPSSANPHGRNG